MLNGSGQGAKRVLKDPMNAHRLLVEAVQACARDRGIAIESHAQGWILELSQGNRHRTLYGYDFGLNRSSTFQLMNDKAGFADACQRRGLPAVPHQIFLHPRLHGYVPGDGNWSALRQVFEGWNRDVVVKSNAGTGGREVVRVCSVRDLEHAVFALFQGARAICLSPFLPLKREVRVVSVAGKSQIAYEKLRTRLVGDGKAPLFTLIADAGIDIGSTTAEPIDAETGVRLDLFETPSTGQRVLLDWRHNLSQGAVPVLLDLRSPHPALDLAAQTQSALDLQMASIDVVETADSWQVLEANSGVMLEHLSRTLDPQGHFARQVYGAALDALFET